MPGEYVQAPTPALISWALSCCYQRSSIPFTIPAVHNSNLECPTLYARSSPSDRGPRSGLHSVSSLFSLAVECVWEIARAQSKSKSQGWCIKCSGPKNRQCCVKCYLARRGHYFQDMAHYYQNTGPEFVKVEW